jgi:hypothetical protein
LPASVPPGAITTAVMLPPGRARFATNPAATGSTLPYRTIGIVLVASRAARMAAVVMARMTSIRSRTSSRANPGKRSTWPSA